MGPMQPLRRCAMLLSHPFNLLVLCLFLAVFTGGELLRARRRGGARNSR